ncbi:MAG: bacillithiol biosynthesis cysteine-adding enzyme BshC [Saprospiraceae bacterium]|nr:bacillithiol biosynthesis cysteine-adding enzyme BshC [Saprospiraceae bacterium]
MNFEFNKFDYSLIPKLSKTDLAYINGDHNLREFYEYDFDTSAFDKIIAEKPYSSEQRELIINQLLKQYEEIPNCENAIGNILKLSHKNCFTIITAHQPLLFGGPVYYIYKIASVIHLCIDLKQKYPEFEFVPVFVLGSEDHDFDEVNHINIYGKTIKWDDEAGGAVGRKSNQNILSTLEELKQILGDSVNSTAVYEMFLDAHSSTNNFAEATQHWVSKLFDEWGLIVANLDDKALKNSFKKIIFEDIVSQASSKLVNATLERTTALGYKAQATPRDINFFYHTNNQRLRIIFEDDLYKIENSNLSFNESQLKKEIDHHPEKFSPNVIMRPIYQEFLFPNLAYVGGGGEIAYWLERKSLFEHYGLKMPMLIRRNSWTFIDKNLSSKMDKLQFEIPYYFKEIDLLIKDFIQNHTTDELDISEERKMLNQLFNSLLEKTENIDRSLSGYIKAEEVKFEKNIDQILFKLQKASKSKHETEIAQLKSIKEKLFPNNTLQERYENFITYYNLWGNAWIDFLVKNSNPFEKKFNFVKDEK